MNDKTDLVQGTLDMLILRTLTLEPMHGFGISRRLGQITDGTFNVNPGTFFPALHRLEEDGMVKGEWGRSENNRRAKYYRLTAGGRRQLQKQVAQWDRVTMAVRQVLEA